MLSDVANKVYFWNKENMVIPGSVHLETNWMQLLHRWAIDPIPEHYL